jgi:hypothetical protein
MESFYCLFERGAHTPLHQMVKGEGTLDQQAKSTQSTSPMKDKKLDAVKMKRRLQKKVEKKLAGLSEREQLELLRKKFGQRSCL